MGLCRVMLAAFQFNDGVVKAPEEYNDYDLRGGIEWARGWLNHGIAVDPISGIHYRTFIKWAQHRRKEINYRDR